MIMEARAALQPDTQRVTLDESVRTCRPAIVPQTRPDDADGEEGSAAPDWNIVRGED
ncbi:hypothetical protein ABTX77_33920 [Streptomyces sp. NPDC097704]|uniref:hypothetical protein n=1 Tax=Streptomyces sp. NPDC097704 TaxID=3157101 RepID=UPI00331FC2E2